MMRWAELLLWQRSIQQPGTHHPMTSLPLVLDDEPIGIILRAGRRLLRPTKIWAYCWCADEPDADDHPHRHLPVEHSR